MNGPSSKQTVTRSFVQGLTWTGAAKALGQVAAWSSTLVVARILSPSDYGIMGMASVFLGLLQAISEFGIGASVVSRPDLSDRLLPELNAASVILGGVGCLAGVLFAPLVGSFYESRELPKVIAAMSLTFFIGSFRSVPWAVLQRDLRFKRLAAYDAFQSIALAIASVTLAFMGFRYWTLVFAAISSTLISTCMAVVIHPIGFARPYWRRVKEVVTFSGNVVAQRLAWYGYSNSDFIVAGRILGSASLGAYSMAYELAHMPSNKLGGILFQVSPATLAALANDRPSLQQFIVRISETLMLLVSPVCFGIAAIAPVFVPLVMGSHWGEAIVPLQILSIYSAITVLLVVPNQTLLVTGQETFGTRYSIAQLLVMPAAFLVGSSWGAVGIALAWPLVHPFLAVLMLRRVLSSIGLSIKVFLRQVVWPSLSACSVMWIVVDRLHHGLQSTLSGWFLLIVLIISGALIYLLMLYLVHREAATRLLSSLKSLRQNAT